MTIRSHKLSGDGSHLTFTSSGNLTGRNADGNAEVFLLGIGSGELIQVTETVGALNVQASLAADGNRLVFQSNADLTGSNPELQNQVFVARRIGLIGGSPTLNNPAVLNGKFTDPGIRDSHTIEIDWGDGSSNTTLLPPVRERDYAASHQFPRNLTPAPIVYTVEVTVTDDDGGSDSAQFSHVQPPGNRAPTVANPIDEFVADEDSVVQFIDLHDVFDDPDIPDGDQIEFSLPPGANSNPSLLGVTLDERGLGLSFAADQIGKGRITVRATDTNGLAVDHSFVVIVQPVNDRPSFTVGPDIFAVGNALPTVIPLWATEMQPGPPNEDSQTWQFELVDVSTPELFDVAPAVTADGTLIFTSVDLSDITESISTEVSILLRDDGGTERGGIDQSEVATFLITFVPTTLTVTTAIDEDDGMLFAGEGNSLREVIQVANTFIGLNTIQFELPPESIISLNSDLPLLTDDIVIEGLGADQLAVRNAFGVVFTVGAESNVELSGLTIRDSQRGILNWGNLTVVDTVITANEVPSNQPGAGIYNTGVLAVTDSTVSENTARRGAGIYSDGGDVQISDTTISNNVARERGGGIYNLGGFLQINESTIFENRADVSGGGVYQNGLNGPELMTIIASEISHNSAGLRGAGVLSIGELILETSAVHNNEVDTAAGSDGEGGGIWLNADGTVVIRESSIYSNSAGIGGGIYSYRDTLVARNTTISGNTASHRGGGVHGGGQFVNVTIAGNHAGISGGGLRSRNAELHNSIIAMNSSGSVFDEILANVDPASSYNLIGTGLGAVDDGDLLLDQHNLFFENSVDIRLGPLADNGGPTLTHALLGGSPAIDAGDSVLSVDEFGIPLAFDQRGTNRTSGASVDMGAFELFDTDVDGVDDSIEDLGPNDGDGDADGIADSQQSHVATLRTPVDGSFVTIVAPVGSSLHDAATIVSPPGGMIPSDANLYPFGFLSFNVTEVAVGAAISVDVIPETTTPLAELVNTFQKYGPSPDNATPHEYQFLFDGTTGAELLSDRVRLHFVDGQRGDSDLSANGTIVDPGALALNPAPVLGTISVPEYGVPQQPIEFSADFTDLGNEAHWATIHWGDGNRSTGTIEAAEEGGKVSASHPYRQPGEYTLTIELTDEFGNTVRSSATVSIIRFTLLPDPQEPAKQILTVGGTSRNDNIQFHSRRRGTQIDARLNGKRIGLFDTRVLSQLVAYGGHGSDKILVDRSIDIPARLYGGPGKDHLFGGNGNDILVRRIGGRSFTRGSRYRLALWPGGRRPAEGRRWG